MVEDSPGVVKVKSFAKINLFLDVLGKRSDGYHNIETIMQTISLHDTMTFGKTKDIGVHVESTVPLPKENTIVRAYWVFKEEFKVNFGLDVKIVKRIPAGGGLGGGSSNAAATLLYLAKQTGVETKDLLKTAEMVGSDVPFFLECGTALVRGRGDQVERLDDLPRYGVVLAIPSVRISTKSAYSWLGEDLFNRSRCKPRELYEAYARMEFDRMKMCSYNIFQEVVIGEFWEVKRALEYLEREHKPLLSMMSGSGSTVFGILPAGEGVFSFVDSSCKITKESKNIL